MAFGEFASLKCVAQVVDLKRLYFIFDAVTLVIELLELSQSLICIKFLLELIKYFVDFLAFLQAE